MAECSSEAGAGATGVIEGRRVAVGQLPWVQRQLGITDMHAVASSSGSSGEAPPLGQTRVHVGVEGQGVVGHLAFSDSLRCALRWAHILGCSSGMHAGAQAVNCSAVTCNMSVPH